MVVESRALLGVRFDFFGKATLKVVLCTSSGGYIKSNCLSVHNLLKGVLSLNNGTHDWGMLPPGGDSTHSHGFKQ